MGVEYVACHCALGRSWCLDLRGASIWLTRGRPRCDFSRTSAASAFVHTHGSAAISARRYTGRRLLWVGRSSRLDSLTPAMSILLTGRFGVLAALGLAVSSCTGRIS